MKILLWWLRASHISQTLGAGCSVFIVIYCPNIFKVIWMSITSDSTDAIIRHCCLTSLSVWWCGISLIEHNKWNKDIRICMYYNIKFFNNNLINKKKMKRLKNTSVLSLFVPKLCKLYKESWEWAAKRWTLATLPCCLWAVPVRNPQWWERLFSLCEWFRQLSPSMFMLSWSRH